MSHKVTVAEENKNRMMALVYCHSKTIKMNCSFLLKVRLTLLIGT